MNIREQYSQRYQNTLQPMAKKLEQFLLETLLGVERIDRVSVRAKSIDRFVAKAEKCKDGGLPKYSDPINQIQDQIGARIICFYLTDVEKIEKCVLDYFRPIEMQTMVPESQSSFGYFGKHFILFIPDEIVEAHDSPRFFELQIKTLFQHAWSEAEHDLIYKPQARVLPGDIERKVAFTAAQAWGADMIFNELYSHVAANDA